MSPVVDHGTAKAVVGETVPIRATVIREGQDAPCVGVVAYDPDGRRRPRRAMSLLARGTDRYGTDLTLDHDGDWTFVVEAWADPFADWRRTAEVKISLGQDTEVVLEEGARLLDRAARRVPRRPRLARAAATLRDTALSGTERLIRATTDEVLTSFAEAPIRDFLTRSSRHPITVHRRRALVGAWYEFFPRSEGAILDGPDGHPRSGTLTTAAKRLPAIADMGFDVVYLPPIHPIGHSFRKGPNNSPDPDPATRGHPGPGSVWAIGSHEGGHDTIHPDLGGIADFDNFVAEARDHGLEVALDLALQCSPDHPWVRAHPEWFRVRADGTIAHAENPPKKYQDIYPLDFDTDPEGIHAEIQRVVRYWMSHGVRIFRVDNPHTKPVELWERLLGDIAATDPDVLFLSEAFTRPAMLRTLAKVGFHQSYTYFTWRNTKEEIQTYLRELTQDSATYLRPNLFANTPDILTEFLQHGGRPAFEIRAILAALLAPTWGIYAGFELCENTALTAGTEEYRDSEKYQLKPRDWEAAEASESTITPLIRTLNSFRRDHPALQELRNLQFHEVDNPNLVSFSKRLANAGTNGDDDTILVVVNLDPHRTHEATVRLSMPALGLATDDTFTATDVVSGESHQWGKTNYVRLDPQFETAHIFTVTRAETA